MTSKTNRFLFWAMSDPAAKSAADMLHALAQKEGRQAQLCDTTAEAQDALNDRSDVTLCLLYTAPERHLARRLDDGSPLDVEAAQWRAETEALLMLYRQNRARCLVFETTHLQRFFQTALSRLGLTAEQTVATEARWSSPNAPMLILMAQTHLQGQPDLEALTEELAASTLLLSNEDTLAADLQTENALQAFRAQRQVLQTLEKERAKSDMAYTGLQNEKAALETISEARRAEIDTLREQVEQAQTVHDIVMQQNALVLAERRQLAEDNTRLARDLDAERQAAATHQEQAAQDKVRLEAEIDRIMRSKSMRMTAPLRTLARLLGRAPDA